MIGYSGGVSLPPVPPVLYVKYLCGKRRVRSIDASLPRR